MKEKNDIFLTGQTSAQKYSTTLVLAHPFSTYVSYDQFFNPPPSVLTCTHFGWPPSPFPQLRTYLMNGLFLNQEK